jgi:carboxyl-terminal processing protease
VNDPVEFAKDHFTGGVGVVLIFDQTNNLPKVNGVIRESPAERAGLQAGDHILQIDGRSTSNKLLAPIVDEMRGFTAKSVKLLIQRGSTNVECTIHRASWDSLKKKMK